MADRLPKSRGTQSFMPGGKPALDGPDANGHAWRAGLSHALCVGFLAVASVYLFSDLLSSQAFFSHENLFPYLRAEQVADELRRGHLPQAFPDALNGAGYAFPRFYPPFSLYLSALLSIAFHDVCLGVNTAFLLSVVFSAAAMYFLANVLTADRWIATAASLVYVSLPYRFVDVYVRAALAECWTFVFYPLILAGLWRAITRRECPWYLPVSVGSLLMTHNITAVYFLGFCLLVCVLGYRWNGVAGAAIPGAAILIGFGIACWFLLPQQYYMKSVWVGDGAFMWADPAHVQDHRVQWYQFFFSDSQHWYGESFAPEFEDLMSFELGLGLFLLPIAVALFLRTRRRQGVAEENRRLVALAALGLAATALCIAFMMYPVGFLSLLPKQFSYIQFPWRMMGLVVFLGAISLALYWKAADLGSYGRMGLFLASVAIVLAVPGFHRRMETQADWNHAAITDPEYVRSQARCGFTVLGEYTPRDFNVAILKDDEADLSFLEEPRLLSGAGAELLSWSRDALDVDLAVRSQSEAAVVAPLIYYDFHSATDARGRRLATSSTEGMLTVRVPEGETRISIRQRVPGVIWFGAGASLVSLAGAFWFDWYLRNRRRRGGAVRDGGSPVERFESGDATRDTQSETLATLGHR